MCTAAPRRELHVCTQKYHGHSGQADDAYFASLEGYRCRRSCACRLARRRQQSGGAADEPLPVVRLHGQQRQPVPPQRRISRVRPAPLRKLRVAPVQRLKWRWVPCVAGHPPAGHNTGIPAYKKAFAHFGRSHLSGHVEPCPRLLSAATCKTRRATGGGRRAGQPPRYTCSSWEAAATAAAAVSGMAGGVSAGHPSSTFPTAGGPSPSRPGSVLPQTHPFFSAEDASPRRPL